MLPEKYLKDLESSERRRSNFWNILSSLAFLVSLLAVGPLIHEAAHVIPLLAIGCPYSVDIGFSFFGGIFASVQPICSPSKLFLMVFYSAGFLATISIGSVLAHSSTFIQDRRHYFFVSATGTGILLSVLLSIGTRGDIQSFLSVAGLSQELATFAMILVVVLVLASSLSGLNALMDMELERQES